MLTADTITDAQIRELMESRGNLCRIALNDPPTLRAQLVRDARSRCAEVLNQRARIAADSELCKCDHERSAHMERVAQCFACKHCFSFSAELNQGKEDSQ